MSTKFYIKDENGRYLSTDGLTKYTCLRGRALYEFLQSEEGKKRCFHVDVDENGDKIGIEAAPEVVGEFEEEDRRARYLRDAEIECQITVVSANVIVSIPGEDEIELGESVACDSSVECEVEKTLDLQNLRQALSQLTDREYDLIYALYLSEKPLTERQLALQTGVTQQTINYRRRAVLKKLEKFF